MTTFDAREKGYENKFAHDEELRFKATARRNKLLGAWAGEKLGLSGPSLDQYAKDVVLADLTEIGDDDVVRKILADFEGKKVVTSEDTVRSVMADLMIKAIAQIEAA